MVNGGGSARPDLERRAAGMTNVRFADYQPKDRLAEVLATGDVHVVPLKRGLARSSVPSKTYSILAAGRPLVASVDLGTEVARVVERAGSGVAVAARRSGRLPRRRRRPRRRPATAGPRWAPRAGRSSSGGPRRRPSPPPTRPCSPSWRATRSAAGPPGSARRPRGQGIIQQEGRPRRAGREAGARSAASGARSSRSPSPLVAVLGLALIFYARNEQPGQRAPPRRSPTRTTGTPPTASTSATSSSPRSSTAPTRTPPTRSASTATATA